MTIPGSSRHISRGVRSQESERRKKEEGRRKKEEGRRKKEVRKVSKLGKRCT
jgi:hypothetical protein